MQSGLILGIESSCDETAAAVVRHGTEVLSNSISSQVKLHADYGGVVPELASREHLRNIVPVVREALHAAGCTYADLEAIAVTSGPGLAGALVVGLSFAKGLSLALGLPLVGVNHLEGHIHAALLSAEAEAEPVLALVVSGGHTHLYLATQQPAAELESKGPARATTWRYRNVGRTVDDAAGEAFDKVAKLLGLPYPGGPWIDRLAPYGTAQPLFRIGRLQPVAADGPRFDFSFSGIKTAVLRHMELVGMRPQAELRRAQFARLAAPTLQDALELCDAAALDVMAAFQATVVSSLVDQTSRAAAHFGARQVLITGGVAANSALRTAALQQFAAQGLAVAFPARGLSTDNAAMIAAAAWPRLLRGEFSPLTLAADPNLRLG